MTSSLAAKAIDALGSLQQQQRTQPKKVRKTTAVATKKNFIKSSSRFLNAVGKVFFSKSGAGVKDELK